jgi:hypothetical protein
MLNPFTISFRWQNTSLQMTTSLDTSTVDFLLGFARLCYHLVKSGNIKMVAQLTISDSNSGMNNMLTFPDFGGVSIDQVMLKGKCTRCQNKRILDFDGYVSRFRSVPRRSA